MFMVLGRVVLRGHDVGQVSPLWRDLLDTVGAMKNLGARHGHFG
jgi:hypothetical protein